MKAGSCSVIKGLCADGGQLQASDPATLRFLAPVRKPTPPRIFGAVACFDRGWVATY